jgi:hypothetical protein
MPRHVTTRPVLPGCASSIRAARGVAAALGVACYAVIGLIQYLLDHKKYRTQKTRTRQGAVNLVPAIASLSLPFETPLGVFLFHARTNPDAFPVENPALYGPV